MPRQEGKHAEAAACEPAAAAAGQRPRQLVLELPLSPGMGLEDFLVTPANAAAFEVIMRWPPADAPGDAPDARQAQAIPHVAAGQGGQMPLVPQSLPANVQQAHALALIGPPGSGKSHLAEIWRLRHDALKATPEALEVEAVPHLLARGALVLEDMPAGNGGSGAAGSLPPRWETALFHLLNMARQSGARVLMTTTTSPVLWPVALPDLKSRLAALPVVELLAPDDELLRAVLVKLFCDRQLVVPQEVVSYLLTRMERSLAAARQLVAALDEAALREKRRITRPLAARVLESLQGDD